MASDRPTKRKRLHPAARRPKVATTRIHETDGPIDDAIAMDRLHQARYFASGLVAGGAGTTLTMLLTAVTMHPASVVALRAIGFVLLGGCLASIRSAMIWGGLAVPRIPSLAFGGFLIYLLVTTSISAPEHAAKGFSAGWWELFAQAVVATVIGAVLRYFCEMEFDDFQYGFDHGLSTVQGVDVLIDR